MKKFNPFVFRDWCVSNQEHRKTRSAALKDIREVYDGNFLPKHHLDRAVVAVVRESLKILGKAVSRATWECYARDQPGAVCLVFDEDSRVIATAKPEEIIAPFIKWADLMITDYTEAELAQNSDDLISDMGSLLDDLAVWEAVVQRAKRHIARKQTAIRKKVLTLPAKPTNNL